jgi:hypothetical protein
MISGEERKLVWKNPGVLRETTVLNKTRLTVPDSMPAAIDIIKQFMEHMCMEPRKYENDESDGGCLAVGRLNEMLYSLEYSSRRDDYLLKTSIQRLIMSQLVSSSVCLLGATGILQRFPIGEYEAAFCHEEA